MEYQPPVHRGLRRPWAVRLLRVPLRMSTVGFMPRSRERGRRSVSMRAWASWKQLLFPMKNGFWARTPVSTTELPPPGPNTFLLSGRKCSRRRLTSLTRRSPATWQFHRQTDRLGISVCVPPAGGIGQVCSGDMCQSLPWGLGASRVPTPGF